MHHPDLNVLRNGIQLRKEDLHGDGPALGLDLLFPAAEADVEKPPEDHAVGRNAGLCQEEKRVLLFLRPHGQIRRSALGGIHGQLHAPVVSGDGKRALRGLFHPCHGNQKGMRGNTHGQKNHERVSSMLVIRRRGLFFMEYLG